MHYSKEQRNEAFGKLPQNVREAIISAQASERFLQLQETQGLHVDVLGEIGDEVGLVMLGLTHPKNLAQNIKKRTNLPEDKVGVIVKEISEKIFYPIRKLLKGVAPDGEEDAFDDKTGVMLKKDEILREIENPVRSVAAARTPSPSQKEELRQEAVIPEEKEGVKEIPRKDVVVDPGKEIEHLEDTREELILDEKKTVPQLKEKTPIPTYKKKLQEAVHQRAEKPPSSAQPFTAPTKSTKADPTRQDLYREPLND